VTRAAASAGEPPTRLITVSVPAGAVVQSTDFRLTALTPQGLPGLLPLGYSALQAFHVQAGGELYAPLGAAIHALPSSVAAVYLARYDLVQHTWVLVGAPLTVVSGSVEAALPSAGTYALVRADEGVVVPPSGALTGVEMQELPATATSSGSVVPSSVAPTGQTAQGRLGVDSPTPLPSGTVVQAEVRETYSLAHERTAPGAGADAGRAAVRGRVEQRRALHRSGAARGERHGESHGATDTARG
jgi:hypothetical protein